VHRLQDDPRVRTKSFGTPKRSAFTSRRRSWWGASFQPVILYSYGSSWGGLYPHERIRASVFADERGLVLARRRNGVFFVFRTGLDFLLRFNHWMGIDPDPRIRNG